MTGQRLLVTVRATVAAGPTSYYRVPDGLVAEPPVAESTFIFVVFVNDMYGPHNMDYPPKR